MKTLKIVTLIMVILTVSISSCKKETISSNDDDQYINGWTRVIGVKGTDTSTTTFMHARTETVGLVIAEDSKLKATLTAYTPGITAAEGIYTVEVTNKLNCDGNINWGWEGLTIGTITPGSDVLLANETVTYTLTGEAKVGKIKLQFHGSCGNSSTLIINITTTILPIEFTSARTERVGKDMKVTFSTDAPQDVDWFFVMWSPDGIKAHEVIKAYVESDHITKSFKLSYPAVKKEDLK